MHDSANHFVVVHVFFCFSQDLSAYRAVFMAFQSPHLLHGGMAETAVLTDLSYIITRMPREVAERVTTYLYRHVPLELIRTRFARVLLRNIERRMQQALHGSPINVRLRQPTEEMQDMVYILNGLHSAVEARMNARLRGRHHGHGLLLESENNGRLSPDATPIPESAWHLNIDRYIDLQTDLVHFEQAAPTAAQLPVFSFMRFPWLLSPATKVRGGRMQEMHDGGRKLSARISHPVLIFLYFLYCCWL